MEIYVILDKKEAHLALKKILDLKISSKANVILVYSVTKDSEPASTVKIVIIFSIKLTFFYLKMRSTNCLEWSSMCLN